MARVWLVAILLAACRTELLDPKEQLGEIDAAIALDLGASDLTSPADLASPQDGGICSPQNFHGYCPEHSTCCPYSCWGGNDVTGWCSPGEGCPLC